MKKRQVGKMKKQSAVRESTVLPPDGAQHHQRCAVPQNASDRRLRFDGATPLLFPQEGAVRSLLASFKTTMTDRAGVELRWKVSGGAVGKGLLQGTDSRKTRLRLVEGFERLGENI